jgi:arginyl-tRNA synthetase
LFLNELKNRLLKELAQVFSQIQQLDDDAKEKVLASIKMDEPKNRDFGDIATNAAMVLAPVFKKNPIAIAQDIKDILAKWQEVEKIDIVRPGFINIVLKDYAIINKLSEIAQAGKDYGKNDSAQSLKIQIEYVSSNPTGHLHIGHGRWGALGDTLSNLYEQNGYDVCREYYVNDYGTQAENFAACVQCLYLKHFNLDLPYPENGYPPETIQVVSDQIIAETGDRFYDSAASCLKDEEHFKRYAIKIMVGLIQKSLSCMGVEFDVWFFESSLYKNENFEKVLKDLKKKDRVYEKDGALWFRSADFGDDKDRVLIRQDGAPTYFASDIMYIINKVDRGFEKLIYILGADHHGYVKRLEAISRAIGMQEGYLSVLIGQLVRIIEEGELLKMSRRKGKSYDLNELIEEVGKDAIRYFFNMNSLDTHMDFDISLAKEKSNKNPVFYVQYAHARICSIIKKITEEVPDQLQTKEACIDVDAVTFADRSERDLAFTLLLYPDVIYDACRANATYFLTQYLNRLATDFHHFYSHNIIIKEGKVHTGRLTLALLAQIVLQNGLSVLGISAPQKM